MRLLDGPGPGKSDPRHLPQTVRAWAGPIICRLHYQAEELQPGDAGTISFSGGLDARLAGSTQDSDRRYWTIFCGLGLVTGCWRVRCSSGTRADCCGRIAGATAEAPSSVDSHLFRLPIASEGSARLTSGVTSGGQGRLTRGGDYVNSSVG